MGQQLQAGVARQVGVAPALFAEPVDELGNDVMVGIGVFAHVHGREVQAEHRDAALRAGEQPVGDEAAGVCAQRVAEQREFLEQLRAAQVVASRDVRQPLVDAPAGVRDLGVEAAQLEPVRLGGVEPDQPGIDVEHGQVGLDRGGQLGGGGHDGRR